MNRHALARTIYEASHLTGQFRLRSGAIATEYFDKYQFEATPQLLREIARALVSHIPDGTDALAGLELGGVPLATALSLQSELPALFVRKKAKPYGTCRLAEGGVVAGRRLLIVEDVVTSGGQIAESVEDLRKLGAEISVAICVIDRESGGRENLSAIGVQLSALFTMSDLRKAAA